MNISSMNNRTLKLQSASHDDNKPAHTQRSLHNTSGNKVYKLRISGSERVVQCAVRWNNGVLAKGVAGMFHTAVISSEPWSCLVGFV